jgi:hypothetical protein
MDSLHSPLNWISLGRGRLKFVTVPFPKELLQSEVHLIDAFRTEAQRLGLSSTEADEAFQILPPPIKGAPAFTWIFSSEWRYYYGQPFTQGGAPVAIGSPQAQAVVQLVRATRVALRSLTSDQLLQWLSQLAEPGRHSDALVEMLAVANVPAGTVPRYEQPGMAVGAKRIDWFVPTKERGVLFEIKNRLGQMAQEVERLRPQLEAGASFIPGEPNTDFEALFKSTYEKFLPINTTSELQGVLLFPGMKLPQPAFTNFFKSRLASRLHFVALSSDGLSVHLEAQSEAVAQAVLQALGWKLGADLVFASNAGA